MTDQSVVGASDTLFCMYRHTHARPMMLDGFDFELFVRVATV